MIHINIACFISCKSHFCRSPFIAKYKYFKKGVMRCEGTIGYSTSNIFDFAKNECSQDPSCGFLVDACGEGQRYILCKKKGDMRTSTCGSILYAKGIDFNITRIIAVMVYFYFLSFASLINDY